MADYKFVDADQLDSDLSGIANAIRKKGGTSASMSFPNGFSSAINAISTGATVKRYPASGLGSFTTNSSGKATVNCGFQPDVVYFRGDTVHSDGMQIDYSTAIVFAVETRTNPAAYLSYEGCTHALIASKTSTGFSVDAVQFGYDWSVTVKSTTYNYVAIKYTE